MGDFKVTIISRGPGGVARVWTMVSSKPFMLPKPVPATPKK